MAIRYLTFVVKTSTFGFDFDTPVLALYTNTAQEIAHLPFIEQVLHEPDGRAIKPVARGFSSLAVPPGVSWLQGPYLAPIAVSEEWLRVMREEYDRRIKVLMVLEPVTSTGTVSDDVPVTGSAPGVDLPDWLGPVIAQEIRMATQDVPVISDKLLAIVAWPEVYRHIEDWAATVTSPHSRSAGRDV